MDGFKSAAQAYFNDEKFSDLTVVCAATGKTFKIEFFYKFDYSSDIPIAEELAQGVKVDPEEEFATQKIECKLELHAWMYSIADKYEISDLRNLSLAKFKEELRNPKMTRTDVELVVSLIYSVLPLPEGDTSLREAVVHQGICIVIKSREKLDANELLAISRSHPVFGVSVLRRFINSFTAVSFKCTHCQKVYEASRVRDQSRCPNCYSQRDYTSIRLTGTIDMDNV
ncbi:uncharacterized protein MYCFIDRAFT_80997 [Pseudocercospora fijiensis CIRAD86]|uniref:BTB domain-containing protein n=1 Tax=Pseudocercospora fijiensis (strain CIRAD86) TaxID=383855 RepID=M3AS16_PSEFD|nr:uncharacterized protein MYCFIDRAFT_80997 [Pseudocercospora fijiensis CIRAD86]EME79918.1 hypothetical protein MYCFIDRAFT_80997 [Pseudocercospora fijiensis CIRAD86]